MPRGRPKKVILEDTPLMKAGELLGMEEVGMLEDDAPATAFDPDLPENKQRFNR